MFKINYIVRDKIEKIFIFFGSHKLDDGVNKVDPNQLYKIEPKNPLFENIFSKEELEYIEKQKIEVELVEQYIHLDDTIETIKQKIKHVFSNKILFEEIYMFYAQETMLDTNKIYKQLTQNKKKKITMDSMIGFLLNFIDLENKSPEAKNNYEIDDLFNLDIVGNKLIKKPLGHRLTSSMFKYYFTSNPYECVSEDPYIQENISQMISTNNLSLLLDYGKIHNNNIYIVIGDDIINDSTTPTFINIYFPFLTNIGVNSRKNYDSIKSQLIEKQNVDLLNFKTNDLFYNIFKDERSGKNNYLGHGIYSIHFTKFQSDNLQIPLETIFKLIHSTQNVPLIQYVPGQKKEPIYRLYVDKYSKDGKKIPFLSKKKIIQIINSMTSSKAITYYIYTFENVNLRCEINIKGEISVFLQLRELFTIDEVNLLIKTYVNPILIEIQNYMKQSGYNMTLFSSLYDTDIEINNINYKFNVEITKKINFSSYMGCLSSAFNIISGKLENNIIMKFKKVSNFNKMSSHEEVITKLINQAYTNKDIISNLKSNFKYSDEKALEIFNKFIEEKAVERDFNENRKLKVKEQPGFQIIVINDKYTNNISIDVTGINNIMYLHTLPIYIDSLLKINNESVSDIYKDDVNSLCKRSLSKKKDSTKEDIVAEVEKPKPRIIESTKLLGSDRGDDIFSAFYDEDSDEEGDSEQDEDEEDDDSEEDEDEENDDEDEDEDEDGLTVFGGADEESVNKELVGIFEKKKKPKVLGNYKISDDSLLDKNIDGMPLSNPNWVFDRMYNRDPVLFLKRATGNFSSYSRSCSSAGLKQPISLTDSEKKRIDEEHPGSYTEAIKYGSTPDKQHWYICPRYWCLKTNTSLSEKEVDDGVCGGREAIIPFQSNKVPKGKAIFEFNHPKQGSHNYPGFFDKSKHPDGYCIPCCFKNWSGDVVKKRREQCMGKSETSKNSASSLKSKEDEAEKEMYILNQDKFPLEPGRFGYLPISIQLFLKTDNTQCYSSKNQNIIKPNHPCLLRCGVEYSENQSLLYCIANFLSKPEENIRRTLSYVKTRIIEVVTIDNFIKYQNGNLLDLFKPSKIDYKKSVNPYYTTGKDKSIFYSKLDKSSTKQMKLFKEIIASYEHFREYISDDNSFIDHTYIWDILCSTNSFLTNGLNLVIMEIADDDITNNVNVYCPSNHYSNNFFDIEKNTLLLIKTGNIYEPIYQYTDIGSSKGKQIVKYFNFTTSNILPNLKTFLLEIQKYFTNCKPLRSTPRVYKFLNNIPLLELENELKKINGVVTDYILNFNNKVVAVKATLTESNIHGILPCHPSSLHDNTKNIVFIDDIKIWMPYDKTLLFLNEVKKRNENIMCSPHSKVMEDGLIVGILTETNQFIMISEPTEFIDDDLETVNDKNYITVDNNILTNTNPTPRDEFVKNVKLETNFYNSFKNLTRTVINKIENRKFKVDLRDYINSNEVYHVKLEKVFELIKELLASYVTFSYYSQEAIDNLPNISSCYNSSKCEESFCLKSGVNDCKLNIPQTNLINSLNNETVYFARISDEMIRFNRVKSFIFDPDIYLSFSKVSYDLNDNEIILLYSSIFGKGYLDYLQYEPLNAYVTNNTYDTMQPDPLTSQKYSNIIQSELISKSDIKQTETVLNSADSLMREDNVISEEENVSIKKNTVQSNINICKSSVSSLDPKLAKFFPTNYSNLEYERNNKCGIQLLNDLLKLNGFNLTKSQIMNELLKMYQQFFENHKKRLFEILKTQEKQEQIEKVENNITTFEDYLMSEEYFISELDILLLAIRYDISVLLLPSKNNIKRRGKITTINFLPSKYSEKNEYYIITNYLYKLKDQTFSTAKFKVLFDTSNYKSDFRLLKLHFDSNPDIKITISDRTDLDIKDFNFEAHYLKKKLKTTKILRQAIEPV